MSQTKSDPPFRAAFAFGAFMLAVAVSSHARAAVINFSPLAQPGAGFNNVGNVYVQDGFQFAGNSALGAWQDSSPNHPVGGLPATSLAQFFAGAQTVMTKVGGGAFDVQSIDLAGYNTTGSGPFNVTFTGTRADSSLVQQTFAPLNANGFTPVLQPFAFSNFTNLVSLSFTQGTAAINAYQFNNVGVSVGGPAGTGFLGPSPYLSFADSPFSGAGLSNFYLEDFEDGALNAPGVTASVVGGNLSVYPAGFAFTDSVDGDNGLIDGNGNSGQSFGVGPADTPADSSTLTFAFDSGALGQFPTHVGLAWTDVGFSTSPQGYGFGLVTFEAFDSLGVSLGTKGPYLLGDGDSVGQTAEDRFFGIIHPGGVSKVTITTNSHDWELDHLQYGFVPEPPTLVMAGTLLPLLAVGALAKCRRRRLRRVAR